jgi:hypothetical protein
VGDAIDIDALAGEPYPVAFAVHDGGLHANFRAAVVEGDAEFGGCSGPKLGVRGQLWQLDQCTAQGKVEDEQDFGALLSEAVTGPVKRRQCGNSDVVARSWPLFRKGLLASQLTPKNLVQLQLEAHWQAVGDQPVGQRCRWQLVVHRRKKQRTEGCKLPFLDHLTRPFVVGAVFEDEFELVVGGQQGQVLPTIPIALAGAGGFDVDDARDARVDLANIEGARGFQRNGVAGVTESAEQWQQAGWASGSPPVTQTRPTSRAATVTAARISGSDIV